MTDTQREAFEAYLESRSYSEHLYKTKWNGEGYNHLQIQEMFEAFKAATAQAEAEKAELVRQCAYTSVHYISDVTEATNARNAILSLLQGVSDAKTNIIA